VALAFLITLAKLEKLLCFGVFPQKELNVACMRFMRKICKEFLPEGKKTSLRVDK